MATLIAGGKDYKIPELNFIALELAWPHIEKATFATNPINGVSAALMVIAAGLIEGEDFKKEEFEVPEEVTDIGMIHTIVGNALKRQLKATEVGQVKSCMMEVIKEAGLEVTEGEMLAVLEEIQAMGQATASQGTAPDLSPSSSQPDAKEGVGTGSENVGA